MLGGDAMMFRVDRLGEIDAQYRMHDVPFLIEWSIHIR